MAIEIKRKEPPKSVEPIQGAFFEALGELVGFKIVPQFSGKLEIHFTHSSDKAIVRNCEMGGRNELTPSEARQLGQALIEMADQIEKGE